MSVNATGADDRAMPREDRELIARCQAGDQAAYGELVRRYREAEYRAAYAVLGNHEQAEDVVQEAFIRAYRAIGRFDSSYSFVAWIKRITVNCAISALHKQHRALPLDAAEVTSDADPAQHTAVSGLHKSVYQALERTTTGVLAAIRVHDTKPDRVSRPVGAAAMAVVLLVVFGLGLGVGRWAWPREVTVTQIVKVPEVREQIVKVEVPVVKERVVVKRVPIYKTKIVYREREVANLAWERTSYYAYSRRELLARPVKCDEIIVRLPSSPIAATAHVREEVQPAEVLDAGESDETPPTQGHWHQLNSTTTASAGAEMIIAQNLSE